jgi:hypothetical protein
LINKGVKTEVNLKLWKKLKFRMELKLNNKRKRQRQKLRVKKIKSQGKIKKGLLKAKSQKN